MMRCTSPRQPGDTRYVRGESCTWHGPIALAGTSLMNVDVTSYGDDEQRLETVEVPCCPHCGGRLVEYLSEDDWRASISPYPDIKDMMRWGQARCFLDFDTLQNAYRQAMEGQS